MTQEDKELLLKDLCARLPYGVKCAYFNTKDEIKVGELLTVWCKEKRVFIDRLSIDYDGGDCVGVIPYLFPLSSMTHEQKRELLESARYEERCEESCGFDSWGFYVNIVGEYEYEYEEDKESIILYPDDIGIDWLNANHFDYRGLIEKGLALDATGLNIY